MGAQPSQSQNEAIDRITSHYLNSGDFNGYPVRNFELAERQARQLLERLLKEGAATIELGDRHPNPYVKALDPGTIESQLERLNKITELSHVCIYPSPEHLSRVVDQAKYDGRPYTLKLALGEPQLRHYSFDLTILEWYRNDPRYTYNSTDIDGQISVSDKYFQSSEMAESDQVVLQTFGFSFDEELNRAVAVFLRYLHGLSPEHQRIWQTKERAGNYMLHPDYWRTSILGEWQERVSMFEAFGEEFHQINQMAKLIGKPPLFKKEFREAERPKEFGFLLRPTLKAFNDFVHLLDKMISENINPAFFGGEVQLTEDRERSDGKVEVAAKGTIRLLQEWLLIKFRPGDPKPLDEMFDSFKEIRKLRQHPAHAIDEDQFDKKYEREQRELMMRAYDAVRTLRLILQNHPATKGHSVPDWLFKGEIWTR